MSSFNPFTRSYHPRKRGPGRYNRLRAFSRKRLSPAKQGGNFQGKGFLSFSESDRICRESLAKAADAAEAPSNIDYRRRAEAYLIAKRGASAGEGK